jgi:tetratricopeptide (TPR) repeat protein/transcriptional regulator with XRE-family HTH domain
VSGGSGFGAVLRSARITAGLSQEELAARAGLSVRAISQLERGRVRRPRLASVRLLADALELTGEDLARFEQAGRAGHAGAADPDRAAPVPAQLPAAVSAFTGRTAELAALDALLAEPGGGGPVVISAVSGTAGVGKTALAVQWAHRSRHRFPDGQLYLNLRGYDPQQPVPAADALARLLTGLGLPGEEVPPEPDERAARFRTEVAGRRMLMVLDNAASVEQVRPLLPGTASCAVLVTSRDSLAGLVAVDGARRVHLDLLPLPDAVALLRALVGARADAEPDAAAALAGQCARLPLALRVAAELAAARPAVPLAELAAELADRQRRLDRLTAGGDPHGTVRTVFSWSYRHLPAAAARLFRLAGLHPGPDFDAAAAAALAGIPDVRPELDLLARAHLLQPAGTGRYAMHDLLRAYAVDRAAADDPVAEQRAALTRLFDHYLGTAAAAMSVLHPGEAEHRPRVPAPVGAPAGTDAARTWLDEELQTLAAVAAATEHGWPEHTVALAATLFRFFDGGGHATVALTLHGQAQRAASRLGDDLGEARAWYGLGMACFRLSRFDIAAEHLERALGLSRRAGDGAGEVRALNVLASVHRIGGRHEQADRCLERALEVHRRSGDRAGEARTHSNLGIARSRAGRQEEAVHHFERALALNRETENRWGEASALNNLGLAQLRLGECGPAVRHLRQALRACRELGHRRGEAHVLDSLGAALTRLGRAEQGAQMHRQALELFREAGDRNGESWALNGLGEAAAAGGAHDEARDRHAAALATGTGDPDQEARAHAGLGRAYAALGDRDRARDHYRRSLALSAELDQPEAGPVRSALAALDR